MQNSPTIILLEPSAQVVFLWLCSKTFNEKLSVVLNTHYLVHLGCRSHTQPLPVSFQLLRPLSVILCSGSLYWFNQYVFKHCLLQGFIQKCTMVSSQIFLQCFLLLLIIHDFRSFRVSLQQFHKFPFCLSQWLASTTRWQAPLM